MDAFNSERIKTWTPWVFSTQVNYTMTIMVVGPLRPFKTDSTLAGPIMMLSMKSGLDPRRHLGWVTGVRGIGGNNQQPPRRRVEKRS